MEPIVPPQSADATHSIRRRVRNEQVLFQANQKSKNLVKSLMKQAGIDSARFEATFVCECSDLSCKEQIVLSVQEFEAVHNASNRFIILPTHMQKDIERIHQNNDEYVVVEKLVAPSLL